MAFDMGDHLAQAITMWMAELPFSLYVSVHAMRKLQPVTFGGPTRNQPENTPPNGLGAVMMNTFIYSLSYF